EAVVFALHRWAVRVGRIGDPHMDLHKLNRYAGLCLAGIPAALLFGQSVEPAVARSVGAVGGPIRVVGMRLAPCRLARHLLRALIGLHADPRRRPRVSTPAVAAESPTGPNRAAANPNQCYVAAGRRPASSSCCRPATSDCRQAHPARARRWRPEGSWAPGFRRAPPSAR